MTTGLKAKILAECKRVMADKKNTITGALNEISESMTNETKSSAGDKHETARAKMQFEQEKLNRQLSEINDQLQELDRIHPATVSESIFSGTVVVTSNGTFFIAIPLGRVMVEQQSIYVISPRSPIGQLMMGLRAHDAFEMNGVQYRISGFY